MKTINQVFPRLFGAALSIAFVLAACGKQIHTESLKPPVLLEPVHCVAVFPFDNHTTYPRAGDIVSDFIASELYAAKKFRILDRMEVEQGARRINLRIPENVSAAFAQELGRRFGVDGVFFGSVSEYWYPNVTGSMDSEQVLKGDEPAVGINVRLLATDSGEVLWSASVSRSSFDILTEQRDPLSRITQLAIRDLFKPLFEQLRTRQIDLLQGCGAAPVPMDGRFHGRVLDSQSGKPAPKASLVVKEPELRVNVDAVTGEFLSPPIPAGIARYLAQAEGYEAFDGTVEVLSNENVSHDVRLSRRAQAAPSPTRPAVLGIKVTDAAGAPVAAQVRFDPDTGFVLSTDAQTGRVKKEIKAGAYTAIVVADKFKTKEKILQLEPGQNFLMEIALEAAVQEPPAAAKLEKDRIVLTETIHFEKGSNKIAEESYPILLQVAAILKEHEEIRKVQIEGHTDDTGGALVNQRLSQNRAEAVRKFLIEGGIGGDRLVALGFGEAVPIADNTTEEGRGRNRRVEFTILERTN
ncbi:MAG: OmpA family protein [Bdellovibrionota bacterium]